MKLKESVKISGIKPEMVFVMIIIDSVYHEIVNQECTITSVSDGKHLNALHSVGYAIDLRSRDTDSNEQWSNRLKKRLAAKIRSRLTDEFDVVIESDHIHVEFDPRTRIHY